VVFKSLPIKYDVYGRARLSDNRTEVPFDFIDVSNREPAPEREPTIEQAADSKALWNFAIDPLTRASSGLVLNSFIDFDQRRVLDAYVENTQFCGFELILKERQPSDAIQIACRMNGRSSGAHAIAATMALEMAGNIKPPPLALIARNLGSCGEMLSESTRHLFLLAGPDYSEAAVSRTNLSIWAKAQVTRAPRSDIHELATIADIMRELNPMSGSLYLEAIRMSRLGSEIATMIFGKYPHPTTVFPGGMGIEANKEIYNQIFGRINTLLDYAKKVTAIWDDLVDFFYDTNPLYRSAGELPGNLLSVGCWDDPESYDASYTNCNDWARRRMAAPGIITDKEWRTARLSDINIGIEEFIDHAYYQPWSQYSFPADPLSMPLSPLHPWNKETIPAPTERRWNERYSWGTAPRWDRQAMETGPIALLWINAVSSGLNCEFIQQDRLGLEFKPPLGKRPPATLHWRIPEKPNSLERNRARAYQLVYAGLAAYANLLKAFDLVGTGQTIMSAGKLLAPQYFAQRSIGAGFWESSSGAVIHHLVNKNLSIENYQIITPTGWMASPRDSSGLPGIYEAAVINTPLLEECTRSEDFTGIDLLRTIRSFDP
jgi:hydrogenase large subunit